MVQIEVSTDDLRTLEADSRGRINLGVKYADQEIEIAVLNATKSES